jgi:hypothetical protein
LASGFENPLHTLNVKGLWLPEVYCIWHRDLVAGEACSDLFIFAIQSQDIGAMYFGTFGSMTH